MDNDLIGSKLRQESTDWIFNPPSASHMDGIWERQIRTTRKVLTLFFASMAPVWMTNPSEHYSVKSKAS